MNVGLYQSAASLSALERWQDAVSQNITSSEVAGFKRRTVQVASEANGEVLVEPGARPDRGEGMPALFPQTRYAISFLPGENRPTGRNLDFAISGEGFFNVRTEDGIAYTRSGQLQVRSDRTLITSQGLEILGESGAPIQLQAQGGPPLVNEDGVVRQGDAIVGKIAVSKATFPSRLVPLAGGLFLPGAGAGMVPVDNAAILQGYQESSNVAPLREMVDLVNIARAYEANQKLIQSRDKIMERTLETLT